MPTAYNNNNNNHNSNKMSLDVLKNDEPCVYCLIPKSNALLDHTHVKGENTVDLGLTITLTHLTGGPICEKEWKQKMLKTKDGIFLFLEICRHPTVFTEFSQFGTLV